MKKIYLVSIIAIIVGTIFAIKPYWFQFMWGWQLLLLPITAGIFMVLVQNEDKSYRFMPRLIIGSVLLGFVYPFIVKLYIYVSEGLNYPIFQHFNPLVGIEISLALITVCIFGGLIGIVIRGTGLLLNKNNKYEKV